MRTILIACFLFALPGCTGTDPLYRSGLWHPTGANEANLRAMIADPQDLVSGASSPNADGQIAAAAIQRYRTDRVKPLPDSGIAQISTVAGGATAAPVAAASPN